ncbi:MAG TPA: twin-arginine translocation signal domain-containing protein, partial [Ilumatobacteraceae bacterium]
MTDSSRRAFLAALAATGVGAAVLPGAADAQSTADSGEGISSTEGSSAAASPNRTELFPAPTAGTYYTFLLGGEFQPANNTYAFS